MKAIARSLRITSKKINLIADLVRRKDVDEAMSILKFTPKKGAKILNKIVHSAVANAENNFKQERATLYIREIVVTEGPTLKRSVPVSRGRANPILKRNAHVWVMLGVKDSETSPETTKGSAEKTTDIKEMKKEETAKKIKPTKKVTPKKTAEKKQNS